VRREAPVLATIFAPSMIATRLCGAETFVRHLREAPDAVAAGLATIARTVADFGEACLHGGADGVFYSINLASRDILSDAQYASLSDLYDRPVAEHIHAKSAFTMLHMHGSHLMFEELVRFPAHALNWHDRGGLTLSDARKRETRAFAGGLDHERTLVTGTPEQIAAEVADAIAQLGGRGIVIAPGCSIPVTVPPENLLAVRAALNS
jgi:uroporphyrinogen decarboxylase